MARTYEQIQKQIAALQREAESVRTREVDGVVQRIKIAIDHYGLTAAQLGFVVTGSSVKKARPQKAPAVTGAKGGYADGLGNTWGGRGPRPAWLKDALGAGKTLEELSIWDKPAKPKVSNAKAPAKKRKAKRSYKDDAGHTWSGFGPQPAWLKEAVAAGRKLEEFAA